MNALSASPSAPSRGASDPVHFSGGLGDLDDRLGETLDRRREEVGDRQRVEEAVVPRDVHLRDRAAEVLVATRGLEGAHALARGERVHEVYVEEPEALHEP